MGLLALLLAALTPSIAAAHPSCAAPRTGPRLTLGDGLSARLDGAWITRQGGGLTEEEPRLRLGATWSRGCAPVPAWAAWTLTLGAEGAQTSRTAPSPGGPLVRVEPIDPLLWAEAAWSPLMAEGPWGQLRLRLQGHRAAALRAGLGADLALTSFGLLALDAWGGLDAAAQPAFWLAGLLRTCDADTLHACLEGTLTLTPGRDDARLTLGAAVLLLGDPLGHLRLGLAWTLSPRLGYAASERAADLSLSLNLPTPW